MWKKIASVSILLLFLLGGCKKEANILRISTTTSIENSGLLDKLIAPFEKENNIRVIYTAVGTGEAIRAAKDGNADLVFVHDKEAEEKFVSEGYGKMRIPIMKNYFMIVGPKGFKEELSDKTAEEIFKWINDKKLTFVSRGDNSGTHLKELTIWNEIKIKPQENYLETGSSMISTLRVASEKQGFCLTDSATFFMHQKKLNLQCYSGKEEILENIYSIIIVNKEKVGSVNEYLSEKFLNFLLNENGKEIIKNYGLMEFNQPLFELINSGKAK